MIYNFAEVSPGLFRSGQPMSPDEWKWAYARGIRRELKLNDPNQGESAERVGIQSHVIWMPNNEPLRNLAQLDWVDFLIDQHAGDPANALLVHCYGGKDRTGIAIARYRVRRCGWSKERAFEEWLAFGSHQYAGLEEAWFSWEPGR